MTVAFPEFNSAASGASAITDRPGAVRSIQGEQAEHSTSTRVRASDDDVDAYVDGASDEVLACRERGRHLFPTIRQAGIHFTGVDDTGLLLRRLLSGDGLWCRLMDDLTCRWPGRDHDTAAGTGDSALSLSR